MNGTIASITLRGMLGRRRALLLFALPLLLLAIAAGVRMGGQNDLQTSAGLLQGFALAPLLPLLCLIAGTGVIGPEIDDGQVMYILTKPIPRWVITTTKLVVAIGLVVVFGVLPTFVAGLVLIGGTADLAVACAVAALVAGVAYCAVFLTLAVVSRHAVTLGLIYTLIWESLVAGYAPGAQALSIYQWGLAVADAMTTATPIAAKVSLGVAVPALIVTIVLGAVLAAARLRTLSPTRSE